MNNRTEEIKEYGFKQFSEGFCVGIYFTSLVAGAVDYISDEKFDHPYLIGITASVSLLCALVTKRREDKQLRDLEKKL